ncbi:MAG: leucyl aminopeptidase family protein [Deltaproteobacteria bacterium]|nr:leucyl aminopeptidase family protein [Deltaproteobacteria bacterium]
MTTASFSAKTRKPTLLAGDFVILPYLDAKTPAFDQRLLPDDYQTLPIPDKKGEFRIVSLTAISRKQIAVAVCRLDLEHQAAFRQARQMVTKALAQCESLGCKRVVTLVDKAHPRLASAVCEGALTGGYQFDKYLSKKKPPISVVLYSPFGNTHFRSSRIVSECINYARDTLNEPPVAIHPVSLAAAYRETGKVHGLKVTVWDEQKLAREKCGGILAVGGGSATKPRLVVAQYAPAKAKCHLGLVGKGITFDSGGYSLKPSKSMAEMKFDMGGAAMMFGAACAIASLKLPIRVTAWMPLAHNAISQDAYNISDVISTRSGQTVEVLNTDAEGRIILADALALACEEKPDYLIDSATLTGAAVVALGEDIAALYGDNRAFNDLLMNAGVEAGEDLWPMPLHTGYDEQLKSTIADMKNTGGSWGGSITAALFLKRFVKNVNNWIHLDIAGPGCKADALDHLGKGAKGFGIATIVEFAKSL